MTDTLFLANDLNALPGISGVTREEATAVERIVWGWLKPVLGLQARPAPVPEEVFSWAIELGAIAYENPTGLSYYQLGEERFGYSAERRAAILAEAAGSSTTNVGRPGIPRGSFPKAECWPDQPRIR